MSIIQFKEANCKNCYKCIRSCPIKAIGFKNEQAQIIEEDCVLCGRCLLACPQNAKSVKNDIDKVRGYITKNEKVYGSLAPSFVSAFKTVDAKKVHAVLKRLGFTHIEETAIGAAHVSREYDKLLKGRNMKNVITTACPTAVFLVERYYPELMDQMAPVVSPMIAHAKMMRAMYGPRIRVVFIGPCISKKQECRDLQNEGLLDAVITFEELEKWMSLEGIDFELDMSEEGGRGDEIKAIKNTMSRFYPAPGGIIRSLNSEERKGYKCVSVDGMDRCMEILDSIRDGDIGNYFIEMNACPGGCLGGPCIKPANGGFLESRDRLVGYIKKSATAKEAPPTADENAKVSFAKKFINKSKEYITPDEKEIREILSEIGKINEEKELNCGACGYSTCREKAIAVYNHKADLHMCLPYMRERAESISNIIINSTPNALIALSRDLYIQEFNESAKRLFSVTNEEVVGKHIYEILQCDDFELVRESGKNIMDRKLYYENYGITVEQSILYIKEHRMILVVMKDISSQEKQLEQIYKVRSETVEIAQKVIEKQMRVAQEIASLLGETTAETKVALTKLKNSILSDMGEKK